jgi:hypothetical protein
VNVLFCPELPDIRNGIGLFVGSQTSAACHVDISCAKMIANIEYWWEIMTRKE